MPSSEAAMVDGSANSDELWVDVNLRGPAAKALALWALLCLGGCGTECTDGQMTCSGASAINVCLDGNWNTALCAHPSVCETTADGKGQCVVPAPQGNDAAGGDASDAQTADAQPPDGQSSDAQTADAGADGDAGPAETNQDGTPAGDQTADADEKVDSNSDSNSDSAAADSAIADAAEVAVIPCPVDVEGQVCDDYIACTLDECDLKTGTCTHKPSDNGCADGNPCTIDSCVASGSTWTCIHPPASGPCSDGNGCTVGDVCKGTSCQGQIKNCADGNACTSDGCFGDCENAPLSGACDADGSVCTPDSCDAGVCKAAASIACDDKNPCTADACDPVASCTFVNAQVGTACDDANPCTLADGCQAGSCGGTPKNCAEGQECSAGTCQVVDHAWTSWKPVVEPKGLQPDPAADTVYHPLTGRTWQRTASATQFNFADAQALCDTLQLAGKSDWRLPTAVELMSLLDPTKTKMEPLIDLGAFPATPAAAFWTGTQWTTSGLYVGLNFQLGSGGPVPTTSKFHVRCVR